MIIIFSIYWLVGFNLLICLSKYVGTFPVSLGSSSDGEATLVTHKERTKFVKKKLREYRVRNHWGAWILCSKSNLVHVFCVLNAHANISRSFNNSSTTSLCYLFPWYQGLYIFPKPLDYYLSLILAIDKRMSKIHAPA